MAEFRIEAFDRASHDRSAFDCGQGALNDFIRTLVTQYEKRKLGKTFVAVAASGGPGVVGFYTRPRRRRGRWGPPGGE
jgi:hypothetical protein